MINGEEVEIFKDPKTDDGTKKSQRGRVEVYRNTETGEITWGDSIKPFGELDQTYPNEESILSTIWENGNFYELQTFSDIRDRVKN